MYTAHVIVKDEWNGPAPYTDIDTVVLAPSTPHPAAEWTAGVYAFGTYDPSLQGPYNLEPVVSSVDERSGRSVWRFNTTSGANEEWLFFPFEDGLHEILQHNVLFQGDQFDKVFTKTVGVMFEDVTAFDIETYYDQGVLGDIEILSTMALNGLQTDGYLTTRDVQNFVNEPIDFTGAGSLEWTYPFTLENAVSIDLTTSSPNIADLDLVLFSWNGSAWVQRGSSAGADANEHIFLPNPEDGDWLIAIDNYSGPAGNFNLQKVVMMRSPGIHATVDPTGPLAANTPVTVHVEYDAPLAEGVNVGSLFIGPPEAPQLKEIPITITKLPMKEGWIEKSPDFELHFPGDSVHYTIDLFNTFPTDPIWWEMTDPIPDMTTYVDAQLTCTGSCGILSYDPISNTLTYEGPLPSYQSTAYTESFENGGLWPDGWTTEHLGDTTYPWVVGNWDPHTGTYHASIRYDSVDQSDEWLFSPAFDVTAMDYEASFWVKTDTLYPGATLKLHVTDTNGNVIDTLWDVINDEVWNTFVYREKVFDLSAYAGQTIKLAWQYVGFDGDSVRLDDVLLPGSLETQPAATIDLEVMVNSDPALVGGETITNTAMLVGAALFPQEKQALIEATAQATILIGQEGLMTSYKEAPAAVDGGETIEYTIHLINTGNGVATVQLVDPIPAGTTYYDHDPGGDYSFSYDALNQEMKWNGALMPGQEKTFTFWVTAPETPGTVITNDALVTWGSEELHLITHTTVWLKVFFPFVINPEAAP